MPGEEPGERPTRRRLPGWLRTVLRLPNGLYRLGLGRLLGERFLQLTHTGRRHQTVLEVLRHDRATDVYIVCSGWGPDADWLRNVARHPEATVTVGRRGRRPARAEPQSLDAGAAELADYARRHPLAFRLITRWLVGSSPDAAPGLYRELAGSLPVVALRVAACPVPLESREPGRGDGRAGPAGPPAATFRAISGWRAGAVARAG